MRPNKVILSVVERHAKEAAYLWTIRDRAVLAPNYKLEDLVRLDGRVEAHFDGLRLAGPEGWDLCKKAVKAEEPGAIFSLAELAFEINDPEKIKEILVLGCAKPSSEREVISALGWLIFERARPILSTLVKDPDSRIRRIGIAGFAVHRQDPGPALIEAMTDLDDRLRARAILAAAELGRRDLASYIRSPKAQPDEDAQFAAAWALTRFDWPDEALKTIAQGENKYSGSALEIGMRSMGLEAAKAWCSSLLSQEKTIRIGVIGVGVIGDPGAIEDLIPFMRNKQTARNAFESFSMITGADLEEEGLIGTVPEGSVDPVGPDEDLPWPAADVIETWWQTHRAQFPSGVRHFRGREITMDTLKNALATETQRYRAAAALELAMREPNLPIFEVRQRGDRQVHYSI